MTLKNQKIISAILVGLAATGGLQALIYIVNLNQVAVFLHTAFWIWIYLWLKIALLYDLHFKNPGSLSRAKARHENIAHWLKRGGKIWATTLIYRFEHLWSWKFLKNHMVYLLLPGMLFWSTVALFYLNLGRVSIQQTFAALTAAAIVVNYWFIKEIFIRKTEKTQSDIFIALSVVKIYAAAAVFGAALAVTRYFCLEPVYFTLAVFSLSFLLIYQSLFQHKATDLKNIGFTLAIAAIMSAAAYFTYIYWGYNYFTAAIFLTALYNLFWGTFHYHIDRTLTKKVFIETLLFCILIAAVVFSVTNFKARILDACSFK